MESYGVKVIIAGAQGEHEIESPSFGTREEAEQELEKVREGQGKSEILKLPWLSVVGGRVVAAHLEDRSIGIG